jgi:peptidylprolyl isomerase domain and WD repeat-containing protein 1
MEGERDVFNEKPSKEDIIAATEESATQRVYSNAIIHTTYGDVHIMLFSNECPRTVENFCVHAKDGYFNGHIFHRVIKSFMIQTGDPTGEARDKFFASRFTNYFFRHGNWRREHLGWRV